jgi:hypothetical protein
VATSAVAETRRQSDRETSDRVDVDVVDAEELVIHGLVRARGDAERHAAAGIVDGDADGGDGFAPPSLVDPPSCCPCDWMVVSTVTPGTPASAKEIAPWLPVAMVTGWPLIMTVAVSLSRLSPPIRSKVKTACAAPWARRASIGEAPGPDHQQFAQAPPASAAMPPVQSPIAPPVKSLRRGSGPRIGELAGDLVVRQGADDPTDRFSIPPETSIATAMPCP